MTEREKDINADIAHYTEILERGLKQALDVLKSKYPEYTFHFSEIDESGNLLIDFN